MLVFVGGAMSFYFLLTQLNVLSHFFKIQIQNVIKEDNFKASMHALSASI